MDKIQQYKDILKRFTSEPEHDDVQVHTIEEPYIYVVPLKIEIDAFANSSDIEDLISVQNIGNGNLKIENVKVEDSEFIDWIKIISNIADIQSSNKIKYKVSLSALKYGKHFGKISIKSNSARDSTKIVNVIVDYLDYEPWEIEPKDECDFGEVQSTQRVRFTYNNKDDAKRVYVMGDFNKWKFKSLRMEKYYDGFETNIPLKIGKYRYRFIVDEIEIPDYTKPTIMDKLRGQCNEIFVPNVEREIKVSNNQTASDLSLNLKSSVSWLILNRNEVIVKSRASEIVRASLNPNELNIGLNEGTITFHSNCNIKPSVSLKVYTKVLTNGTDRTSEPTRRKHLERRLYDSHLLGTIRSIVGTKSRKLLVTGLFIVLFSIYLIYRITSFNKNSEPTFTYTEIAVQSMPPGVQVYRDGIEEGLTPIVLKEVKSGSIIVLRYNSIERVFKINEQNQFVIFCNFTNQ